MAKKGQSKEENKKICPYFNRGYCQFQETCRNKHPKEVCDDENCDELCNKRHPNPCKFGYRCKFFKKKICLFSHVIVTQAFDDSKSKELIKKLTKKVDNLDKKVEDLQTNLKKKDEEMSAMQQNLIALGKSVKDFEKEIGAVEERVIDAANESISVLENSFRIPEKTLYKCEECKFTSESERGLKVHIKRKHTILLDIPQSCEFCEVRCYNKGNLEDHLKEHTYNELKYKCEDCDFLANDILSLDVHVERKHSGNFKCAICEFTAKNEEHLNTHLHTCETFTCEYCFPKFIAKTLADLIPHLKTKHPKHLENTSIIHTKLARGDADKVSKRKVNSSYLIKDIN